MTEREEFVADIVINSGDALQSLKRLERAADQLTANWGDVAEVTEKLTAYYGRLGAAANAYINTDTRLRAQSERTQETLGRLEVAAGKLLVGVANLDTGMGSLDGILTVVEDSVGGLATTLGAMEKEGGAARLAAEGIEVALSSLLLGPLTGIVVAFKVYNALLGEGAKQTEKLTLKTVEATAALRQLDVEFDAEQRQRKAEVEGEKALEEERANIRARARAGDEESIRILDLQTRGYTEAYAKRIAAAEKAQQEEQELRSQDARLAREVGPEYLRTLGLMEAQTLGVAGATEEARSAAERWMQTLSGMGTAVRPAAQAAEAALPRAEVAAGQENFAPGLDALDLYAENFRARKALQDEDMRVRDRAHAQIIAQVDEQTSAMADVGKAYDSVLLSGIGLADGLVKLGIAFGDSSISGREFGFQMAQMFGDFASAAGDVMIAAAIGELALFEGNPAGALAAGIALKVLGSVLSGVAQSRLSKGGGGGSRSGAAATTRSVLDSFGQRGGGSDREDNNVVVYAQFGADRLEPTFTRVVRSAQRNGRLPQSFGRV